MAHHFVSFDQNENIHHHANAASEDFFAEYSRHQSIHENNHHHNNNNNNNNNTNIIEELVEEENSKLNKIKYGKLCTLFVTFLWLLLSSFTVVGFVMAFGSNEVIFRFSFLAFSWFMTIINLPFILRPILKSISLYHEQMDEFRNKCFYCLHRFMYIIFIFINIINTILLLNKVFFLASFFIGIHNILLAFKVGAYLAMKIRGKFHAIHFVLLCVAMFTVSMLTGSTQNGLFLLGCVVIWLINFSIFVVVSSTIKRKHKRWLRHQRRKVRHTKIKEIKEKEKYSNDSQIPPPPSSAPPSVPSSQIAVAESYRLYSPSISAMTPQLQGMNEIDGFAPPNMLFLRLNNEGKTEHDLMRLHEEGMAEYKPYDINVLPPNYNNYNNYNRDMRVPSVSQLPHHMGLQNQPSESIKSSVAPQQSQQEMNLMKPLMLRYKQARHVTCCCNKIICGLRTFLQLQTTVTAVSIWGSIVLFLLNKISWTCYVLMIFITVTTVWNPICFTKRCHNVHNSKTCCSIEKCGLCLAYLFGIITVLIAAGLCSILFIVANPFSVGNIEETAGDHLIDEAPDILNLKEAQTKLALIYTVWIIAFISFLNYLPGAGWVFYQIPVAFAMINFLSFIIFLFVPLVLVDAFIQQSTPCSTDDDFTCEIQNNSVNTLYNFLYNGYNDRLINDDDNWLLYIPHLTALILFTSYLSLTGLGCSWYRFKKSIIESQAKLTGNKKGQKSKDFPMGIIMFFTLCLAFGDVVSDAIYAWGTTADQWASPTLRYLTRGLFIMQVLIQVFSYSDTLKELRQSLKKHKSLPHCGWCYDNCTPCYWIITFPYFIIVFIIGIGLGLTKLFAVKQMQEWWFRLLIRGYKKEVEKAESIRNENVDNIRQELGLNDQNAKLDVIASNSIWSVINESEKKIPPTMASMNAPRPMLNENNDVILQINDNKENMPRKEIRIQIEKSEETELDTPSCLDINGQESLLMLSSPLHEPIESKDISAEIKAAMNDIKEDKKDIHLSTSSTFPKKKDSFLMVSLPFHEPNVSKDISAEIEAAMNEIKPDKKDTHLSPTSPNKHKQQQQYSENDQPTPMSGDGDHEFPNITPVPCSKSQSDLNDKSGGFNNIQTDGVNNDDNPWMNVMDNNDNMYDKEIPTPMVNDKDIAIDIQQDIKDVDKEEYDSKPPTPVNKDTLILSPIKTTLINHHITAQSNELEMEMINKNNQIWEPIEYPNNNNTDNADDNITAPPSRKATYTGTATQIHDIITPKMEKLRAKLSNAIPADDNNNNVDDDIEIITAPETGHIHDIATPKMIKLRETLSIESNENVVEETGDDEDKLVELVTLEEYKEISVKISDDNDNDKEKKKEKKKEKEDNNKIEDKPLKDAPKKRRVANILDENNEWLGYEISGDSILWKIYLWIDSWTPIWMSNLKVRANIYNSYFMSELIVESWPQLVTNLVNSYYKGFTTISNISAVFSIIMISYTMLKIIYYVGVRNRSLDQFVL